MKKYKIAFVTEYLSPQKNGIAVRYSNLINYFKNDKDFITVDVYGPKGHCVDFELNTVNNYFYKENYLCFANMEQITRLSSGYYDFIYVVLPPNFSYFIFSLLMKMKESRTKIITSNHVDLTSYISEYLPAGMFADIGEFLSSSMYQFQNNMSDMIISPSLTKEIKDFIIPSKLYLNPNGYDQEIFKHHKKTSRTNKLVYFGRIALEKNIDRTIELFNILDDTYTLDIIGDGPELRRLIKENHGNNRIRFLGKREHNFISEHLKTCDIAITSSLSETFCMTILESLATGTPVIYPQCSVFDSLYYPEIPEGRFEVGDEDSFLAAVDKIYEDYDNLSSRAHNFASSMSWEKIYSDLKIKILSL